MPFASYPIFVLSGTFCCRGRVVKDIVLLGGRKLILEGGAIRIFERSSDLIMELWVRERWGLESLRFFAA